MKWETRGSQHPAKPLILAHFPELGSKQDACGQKHWRPPPNAHRGRPCPVLEGSGTTSFSGCGWDWHSPLGRPALSRMAVRMLWAKLGLSVWPSPWLLQEFSLNEMEQNRRLWQEGQEDRQTGGWAVGEEGAQGIQVLGALCWVQCGGHW